MPGELILGIETATPGGGIALCRKDGGLLAHRWAFCKTGYSRRLMASIDEALREAGADPSELAAIGVTRGPGSFTGVRIGLTTAKTLAYSLEVPLHLFSTLDAMAARCPIVNAPVCVMLDARRSEIYSGIYMASDEGEKRALRPPKVEFCASLLDFMAERIEGKIWFAGDGAVKYQEEIAARLGARARMVPAPWNHPAADIVAILAARALSKGKAGTDPLQAAPDYLRGSDAERNLAARATPS